MALFCFCHQSMNLCLAPRELYLVQNNFCT
jgi:hypothetical protein